MLGIGGTRSFYRQEGSVDLYQYYTFNPRLTLKYTFNDRSYLRLRSSISNEMPSLGNLSAIDQVVDSLQIQRGNPNLEAYLHYSNTLDSEWSKGIFYTYFSLAYNYKPRAIMDEKYVEGNKIIQTWDNQKSWQRIAPMIQLRVGPVADILQFSVSGGLNHFINRGNTYHHKYSNWWLDASVSASWKNQRIRQLEEFQLHVSGYDQPELVQRRDIERRRKCPDYHAELQVERPADRSRYV